MRRSRHSAPSPVHSAVLRRLRRPWQWLLLLLLGTPLVWAATGVSLNNLVITTVQQLSFAQARAEVDINQRFTQAATVRLSPGAVSYRSSDPAVATVDARTGQATGVLAGEATIIASQAASAPYPAASASYTLKVKGLPLSFNPWSLASVMYGVPAFQISAPTSNVSGATITYALKDPSTTVASITPQGLITVRAVGRTTIVATQRAYQSYDGGTVEAEFTVSAVPGLTDRELPYTPVPIDLPAQLGGQAVTYSSGSTGVATITGTSGQPQVSLRGLGETELRAANAMGIVIATARWRVVAGLPGLALQAVPPLASTTFETTLSASSASPAPISFSIPDDIQRSHMAEIDPATGRLLVKGPGTVQVHATQAATGLYAAATATTAVTINDGRPGVVITAWPTQTLHNGDTFEVRYRVNFPFFSFQSWVSHAFTQTDGRVIAGVNLVSNTPPARYGEEGRYVFQVANDPLLRLNGTYRFVLASVSPPTFSGDIHGEFNNPALYRELQFQYVPPHPFNLGAPWQMVYGERPVMPQTYTDTGALVPAGALGHCDLFRSSNTNVLRGVGTPIGVSFDKDHWETAGVGTTTISCGRNGDYLDTTLTVIGADPRLQGFSAITIGMDSSPYTPPPAASLNPSNEWRYEVLQLPGQPVVAEMVNGQLVPRVPGQGRIRVTQRAGNNFREASLEADLTVTSAQDRSFATMYATYGDPDFAIPRPQGVASGVAIDYQFENPAQDVASISNGMIHILNAGTVNIQARVGGSLIATGQLIVRKAKPRLLFYFAPGLYFSSTCGEVWTWPIANQGTSNKVNGTLVTNSDGALYYPMGTEEGRVDNGPNQTYPYYRRYMGHAAYTPDMAMPTQAWVEQAETRNFEAAVSERIQYSVWGNDRVGFFDGRWVLSCSQ